MIQLQLGYNYISLGKFYFNIVMNKGCKKEQVEQCFWFFVKSAVQKPKHCLTCSFFAPLGHDLTHKTDTESLFADAASTRSSAATRRPANPSR